MLKSTKYLLIFAAILFGCTTSDKSDLASFVNPFIGTDGHGHTYPGATVPFGMVQLSPDTRIINWDACSGYHSSDSTIMGFSHTHLSGTGAIDYGDILLMPTTGEAILEPGDETDTNSGYRSTFSHDTEVAEAGFYKVKLDDYNVDAELTATERTGFHKYIFNEGGESNVIVDLKHDVGANRILSSGINVISKTEVQGWRHSKGWANSQMLFFVAEFSKPFESYGISNDDDLSTDIETAEGLDIKSYFKYNLEKGEEILVKVGLSSVSIEGARENLKAENAEWNFAGVKNQAREKWNTILGKVQVESKSKDDKTVFYTAMYHSFLAPNLYSDVNGNYRGMDMEVHKSDRNIYTVFSLWDTFRATHPLFTITDPEFAGDLVNTMITKYEQSGLLPVWELSACETGCMIGYHSIPVIADVLAKGINNFDVEKSFEAMKKSAMEDHLGLEFYKEQGFIPVDKEHEGVSKTLEYAYDDWCIAVVAKMLGHEEDYEYFINRAQFYKNVYDKETGFMRGKKNGKFIVPFDPSEVSGNYTEANAWQYSYFVPQDVDGLKDIVGGDEEFIKSLDKLFTADVSLSGRSQPDISGMIGQYAHGNEPSHHMAYLYNFAGVPYKTQEVIDEIRKELYTTERDGLCGNEDCGQMSSWYVFSALGFYPVTPGLDYYVIGSPMFDKAEINLAGGKVFTVEAKNISDNNIYVQSVELNGQAYELSYIKHSDIMNGGKLVFVMGSEPNLDYGKAVENRPVSRIENKKFITVPVFTSGERIFKGETKVEMEVVDGITIYYTLDGSEPNENSAKYSEPVSITKSLRLRAIAIDGEGNKSMIVASEHTKIPDGLSIKINSEFAHNYTAGGDMALIDMDRGDTDFMSGKWQGWQGVDVDAVIDFGEKQDINYIGLSCLSDQDKWIFYPGNVEFLVSDDGENFKQIGVVQNPAISDDPGAKVKEFGKEFNNLKARYVQVKAANAGVCPEWHKGAGGETWIFADEIVIR